MDISDGSISRTDAGVVQDWNFGYLVQRWLVVLEILTNIKGRCSKITPRAYLRFSNDSVGGGTRPALVIRNRGLNLRGLNLDGVEKLLVNHAWI